MPHRALFAEIVRRGFLPLLLLGDLGSGTLPAEAQTRAVAASPEASASDVRLRAIGADRARGRADAVVVDAGVLVHTAVLYPVDGAGVVQASGDAAGQANQVLDMLRTVLRSAGTDLARVARLHVYVADASVTAAVDRVLAARFGGRSTPALTIVESRMPVEGALVAMDAIAVTARPAGARAERITVPGVPLHAGGTHVAVQPAGPFVIVSGRAAPGAFATAVSGTMDQLRGDLKAVGLEFQHVVQVKAFLSDMTRIDELRRLVTAAFQESAPPLVVTEWRDGSLPVEIELMATAPGATGGAERVTFIEPISSRYSRVARVYGGRPVFVSGLTGAAADPAAQVRDLFERLRRVLAAAGSDMRHIAKATYYVSDKAADQEINTVRPSLYDATRPPAASKISVPGTGQPGKVTVIDAIAVTTDR